MKALLTAKQIVHFRNFGHIRFENFPFQWETIPNAEIDTRDLWRKSPDLKKFLLRVLAPIALELTKKRALRLCCDGWQKEMPSVQRMQDMFCFQGLICIFAFSLDPASSEISLDAFEPSTLATQLATPAYLVAFGSENTVLVENKKDPFTLETRNLGYVYGDRLRSEFHPLVTP